MYEREQTLALGTSEIQAVHCEYVANNLSKATIKSVYWRQSDGEHV
jgi:hypothetical protein